MNPLAKPGDYLKEIMGIYLDVQHIISSNPIQEYEIEAKIDSWKRRHPKAHIIKTIIHPWESSYYKYALSIGFAYEATSRLAVSLLPQIHEKNLENLPVNFKGSNSNNQDGSRGVGYVARENGKFGSYPEHDDYSEGS